MNTLSNSIDSLKSKAYSVILGKDNLRKERCLKELLNGLAQDVKGSTPIPKIFKEFRKNDLLFALQSPQLFSPSNIVILKINDDLKANEIKELNDCLKQIPSKTWLIITLTELRKNSAFYKQASQDNCLIEYEELKSASLLNWIKNECSDQGLIKFPENMPMLLADVNNSDLDQIFKQIIFLATYAENSTLSQAELNKLIPQSLDTSEYALLDALKNRDLAKSEQLLQEILLMGQNPFLILALLIKNYKQYYQIRVLSEQGVPVSAQQQQLGLPPWLYSKLAPQVKNLNRQKITASLKHLMWADSRLKDKSLGADSVLSELCSKLCA
jgi:DNA polymerase III delta subunit